MESINLSKLVLSSHFLNILNDENIHFDWILTDNKTLAKDWATLLINSHLKDFFSKLSSNWKYLIILDKIWISDIFPYIENFKSLSIISANSAIGGFWNKYHPELNYLQKEHTNNFNYYFPWDLENFIKLLKNKTNGIYPLPSQEVSDNIYDSPSEEEEWIQFIDKNLIDESEVLSLLSPKNSDLFIIWFWNHFEELVKLSQLLANNPARISLAIINNWNYLFSEGFKDYYKDCKKIAIIMDCNINNDIKKQLNILWKPIEFITPEFNKLTSVFPEYYYEQTWFNAISLYEKCLNLV